MNEALPTTVVVPTVGRPSLHALVDRLHAASGRRPAEIIVVDDRPDPSGAAVVDPARARIAWSGGRGPAAARNVGWRLAATSWVSFLDDDVLPDDDWLKHLEDDLRTADPDVAGVQGQVTVPLPTDRRPTDWERSTAGLEQAAWITADLTYRRHVLAEVGGFDERFRRAFREDADIALRIMDRGYRLAVGQRRVVHPVRPADAWVSVRAQAGNADDALMRRVHGADWRMRAGALPGRRPRHIAVTAFGAGALALTLTGRRRAALVAGLGWLAGTAEFAAARIAPGPRDLHEISRMAITSAIIPAVATWHAAQGAVRHRGARGWRGLPELVLFDRDGTLVRDVPYNAEPQRVQPQPGALVALQRLRALGVRTGVVTNQSGIARGKLTADDASRVNDAVERALGPFDVWRMCPHAPDDGCECRKPAPGMILAACAELGVSPDRCVVVGDIGSDIAAAEAAGAAGVLVPTPQTRPDEVDRAPVVRRDLASAVELILVPT